MMFYKFTLKNLMIDGLIIGLWVFTILRWKYAPPVDAGVLEIFWVMLIAGIALVRWAYLAWSYFYGKDANKNPSLLFKIHRVWVTFGAVAAFVTYFAIIFIFLL